MTPQRRHRPPAAVAARASNEAEQQLTVRLPFLGVLLYLIVRGDGMRDRAIKAEAEQKESGALSAEEFERAKAKLLG